MIRRMLVSPRVNVIVELSVKRRNGFPSGFEGDVLILFLLPPVCTLRQTGTEAEVNFPLGD